MWPFRRSRDPGSDESKKALIEATKSLKTVQSRQSEVDEVTEGLKKFRRENHFSQHITRIITEGPK